MKIFNLLSIPIVLLFLFSCNNTTDPHISKEIKKVSIKSSEVFEYQTDISGDEELVTITKQPDHYKMSRIVRNSREAVYKYQSKNGFKGTAHIELKLETGANGADSNPNIELIKSEITVN
ncbi:hypothetical protein CK503_00245 [Aliifodinibius salipaludis]|uniref:Uncharacterized protein n=1 Tax=Fodinibius salipaludis TaxID=2032627 RepID=A0A2A2GE91_9BACT|nr:hypothetical protein [Aliifodinibius salipaludis]PAU95530.1 hypothetical protein CK503_00245 [Aliifodinibius salipaludis]